MARAAESATHRGFRALRNHRYPSPLTPPPRGRGKWNLSDTPRTRRTLARMHPGLRPYFDLVYPLFWPWLWFNLIRWCRWYERTGISALLSVDRFGNIRVMRVADEAPPDDLYTYDPPALSRWAAPALASALPEAFTAPEAPAAPAGCVRTFCPEFRTACGLSSDTLACIRAPPSGQTPTQPVHT